MGWDANRGVGTVDEFDGDPGPLDWMGDALGYPLPVGTASTNPPDGLDPWIMNMARLDEVGVRDALRARWAGIAEKGPAALRETLLEFRPAAIVVLGDAACLKLEGPAGGARYLGAPLAESDLEESLAAFGCSDCLALREFYRNFHGLRDSPPGESGEFISPPAWETFEGFGWPLAEDDEIWSSAIVLFVALNGDLLLLGEAGIAWAVMARGGIRRLHDSVNEFLESYAEFLKRGEGLDSYSLISYKPAARMLGAP